MGQTFPVSGHKRLSSVSVSITEETAVNERPSLGYSALAKSETPRSRTDGLRRMAFLLIALVLVGTVFYFLTRAVQSSTANATRDDSPIHTDQ